MSAGFYGLAMAALMVGAGFATWWVAGRAASGALGRNAWAGYRTRTTMASDEAWLAAQRAGEPHAMGAGHLLVITGVACLVLAVLAFVDAIGSDASFLTITLVLLAGGIVASLLVARGAMVAQRAAHRVSEPLDHIG